MLIHRWLDDPVIKELLFIKKRNYFLMSDIKNTL